MHTDHHPMLRCRGGPLRPSAPLLHQLPDDVLHLIMVQLRGNAAVKLGSLHSALRRALGRISSLQPSVSLDVCEIRDGGRTRGEQAAFQQWERRRDSFAAFRLAHPAVAMEAMVLRFALLWCHRLSPAFRVLL